MYAYPKITAELIRLMRVHGMSDADIAKELGLKRKIIIDVIGEAEKGQEKKRSNKVTFFDWPDSRKKEFERDYLAGIHLKIMSKKYGVSTVTLSRYAAIIGLPKRQHKKTNKEEYIDICKQLGIKPKERKTGRPRKNLTETNAEARARGMTYGKLVAMQYLEEQSNARRDKAVR